MSTSRKRIVGPVSVFFLLLSFVSSCEALSTSIGSAVSNAVQETRSNYLNMYKLFGITPSEPIVSLKRCSVSSSGPDDDDEEEDISHVGDDSKGYGLFADKDIASGETILCIPLSVCLCDDNPPTWLQESFPSKKQVDCDWVIRLAAVFLDCWRTHRHLVDDADKNNKDDDDGSSVAPVDAAYRLWLSMLTDADTFRKVLPVYWKADMVRKTGSIELQFRVAAYHSQQSDDGRAIKAKRMLQLFTQSMDDYDDDFDVIATLQPTERDCRYAMDVVESRCCRLGRRCILAPVLDFINHDNDANAEFSFAQKEQQKESYPTSETAVDDNGSSTPTTKTTSENGYIQVRALRDIPKGEEIRIDYGPSASPAYRSLFTYGFVNRAEPSFTFILSDPSTKSNEDTFLTPQPTTRLFAVQPSSFPHDLVATACQLVGEKKVALTPNVLTYLLDCTNRQVTATGNLASDDTANSKKNDVVSTSISEQLALELRHVERQALLDFQRKLTRLAQNRERKMK